MAYKYFDLNFDKSLFFQAFLSILLVSTLSNHLSVSDTVDMFVEIFFSSALIFILGFIFKLEKEDFFKLFTFICFANLPLIFKVPTEIIASKYPLIGSVFAFFLSIWILNLSLIGISTACKISKSRAFLLMLMPLILLILVISLLLLQLIVPLTQLFL